MITNFHIVYDYCINPNIKFLSIVHYLTPLYNLQINHRNIYTVILLIKIIYVYIRRKQQFFSIFQRICNRNPKSFGNFKSYGLLLSRPRPDLSLVDATLLNLLRQYYVHLLIYQDNLYIFSVAYILKRVVLIMLN